jgi:hypothetical protein
MDPLTLIPDELFVHVLSFLDVCDLCNCSQVSKQWYLLADDSMLWKAHCRRLWADKIYVAAHIRTDHDSKRAYRQSLQDSKRRILTVDELCTMSWNFRFKASAGTFFILSDPWYDCLFVCLFECVFFFFHQHLKIIHTYISGGMDILPVK